MLVVALVHLATPIEVEAAGLAADLGVTAYEARLLIAGGVPAVVLTTPDRARAQAVLSGIEARGNQAIGCDDAEVARYADMVSVKRFELQAEGLAAEVRSGGTARLPYDDVLCGLRAVHRHRLESTVETKVTKFSAGRAIATGGLMMTKGSVRESTSTTEGRDTVLYLFRRSGEMPWTVADTGVHYNGLGPDIAPTQAENFARFVTRLKSLCPTAVFDDRLLSAKRVPERTIAKQKSSATSSSDGVDLLAHFLARAIARHATPPYRG